MISELYGDFMRPRRTLSFFQAFPSVELVNYQRPIEHLLFKLHRT